MQAQMVETAQAAVGRHGSDMFASAVRETADANTFINAQQAPLPSESEMRHFAAFSMARRT
jgi:hypothetical protein